MSGLESKANHLNTWLITIKTEKSYSGNSGYKDQPKKYYEFDNLVQNSKQISTNDIVIIRVDNQIIGVSIITDKKQTKANKMLFTCPKCNTTRIRKRKTEQPTWACSENHFFDVPKERIAQVDHFSISYAAKFRKMQQTVPWQMLKPFFKNSSTTSIRPVNWESLINTEQIELAALANHVNHFVDYIDPMYARPQEEYDLTGFSEENSPYKHDLRSSNWTGKKSLQEVAENITVMGPIAVAGLQEWLHYFEHERNDPDPPKGMPEDLLNQLKQLKNELSDVIELAETKPNLLNWENIEAIGAKARILLKPGIDAGQLFIAGLPISGSGLLLGLSTLKAIEYFTETSIPLDSTTAAAHFATGTAASIAIAKIKDKK